MKPAALTVGVNKAYNAVVKNATNQWVIIIISSAGKINPTTHRVENDSYASHFQRKLHPM
jgi:hypothetical protein